MSWIHISLIVLVTAFCGSANLVAFAQAVSEDKLKQCISLRNEQTAALVAEDWSHLERLANRYLQNCKGVYGSEDYSSGYEQLAIAHNQRDNAMAALEASVACIDVFYSNSGCHIEKVKALFNLEYF